MKGNVIVGQSGGPTAAINATLSGVIRGAKKAIADGAVEKIYGMRNGIEGFMQERLVDLDATFASLTDLSLLEATPAAALGSCRKKLPAPELGNETYEKIFSLFEKYNIRYFFYIGGNDSMDTVAKLTQYAKMIGHELRAVGVPKTIDNDLAATDHTPGFGSAAKYIATTISEILCDTAVYQIPAVTIVEIMGRDAGWLTTAAALPSLHGKGVDYIYLPEVPFSVDAFIEDVKKALARHPNVTIAVSEGIRDKDGNYISASGAKDNFGHVQLTGAGRVLEALVRDRIGCKVRSIEISLMQRCAAHLASLTDIQESVQTGEAAVNFALLGRVGTMVCIKRYEGEKYETYFEALDVASIANAVRSVPLEYINEEHNGVTQACIDYLAPLIIGELPIIYKNGMPLHFYFD